MRYRYSKTQLAQRALTLHFTPADIALPPDMTLEPSREPELKVGWAARIAIEIPHGGSKVSLDRIVELAERRLEGRRPIFWEQNDRLLGTFRMSSANDADREQLERFTSGLVRLLGASDDDVVKSEVGMSRRPWKVNNKG